MLAVLLGSRVLAANTRDRKLRPIDESRKDPSFLAFRSRLLSAIARRDKSFILRIVDPNIRNSFGGDDGVEEFKATWKLGSRNCELWDELRTILLLGCTREAKHQYVAPYVFSRFEPDEDLDGFNALVILGCNVSVRARPDRSAPVITRLTYHIVREGGQGYDGTSKWVEIRTPSGKTGYVFHQYIRSPLDYRAIFERKRGRWVMTFLAAGD